MNPPKFSPQLVFGSHAEEAANFYVSVFKNSRIIMTRRFSEEDMAALSNLPEEDRPGKAGDVNSVIFELDGQEFMAINGGHYFSFSPGISLYTRCKTQEEIDEVWEKLSEGGEAQPCGWIKDKYGVSWQIVPEIVWGMLKDPDQAKAHRVANTIFKMTKLDIEAIQAAYNGSEQVDGSSSN